MNLERYPYFASDDFKNYYFYSSGPNGQIKKGVRFSKMSDHPIMYNLAFGDMSEQTDMIDDLVISNNNDREVVLATVANTGSTPTRTRLYQMGIAGMLVDIKRDFDVYGFKNGLWRPFQKNINYTAFLVKRK